MIGKYKIKFSSDLETIRQIIKATVDTKALVFTWRRMGSLKEVEDEWTEIDMMNGHWFITGFHSECNRVAATVPKNWYRIEEFQEITLEGFLKTLEQ